MQETDSFSYYSEFLPTVSIAVVFEENPQYEDLIPFFEDYGYGFMVPGKNLVIIDGEQLINGKGSEVLKFIEAHEISHVIMGHDGPRNEDDEIDADLGAYILLKKSGYLDSVKTLLRQFRNRHGINFNEKLLERVKKYFS
jgi:hypothetical protein